MGSCLSKKTVSSSSAAAAATVSVSATVPVDPRNCMSNDAKKVESEPNIKKITDKEEAKKQEEEESVVKKEIFVIKHRKSHDRDRDRDRRSPPPPQQIDVVVDEAVGNNNNMNASNTIVRTSSCTKEEVDAILIQCGRLSRSNSSGKAPSSAKKYSGSKRSYDFDHDAAESKECGDDVDNDEDDDQAAEKRQHRQRHRQSSRPSSSSQGRRRTPSRERDRDQQQRSGSRERATSSGSGRRVSRSPGRRSENNQNTSTIATPATANANRPGKLVSVPATVSSLAMDKSNNAGHVEPQTTTSIKRISVKRNAGEGVTVGSRTAASPRSQSPVRANARGSNENQQPSLSRCSSRKAEQSPYRRNPLSEIDPNSLAYPQTACNQAPCTNVLNQSPMKKPNVESKNDRTVAQGTNYKSSSRNNKAVNPNYTAKEQKQIVEEAKTQPPTTTTHVNMTAVAASGAETESLKPQTLTRSRSSRRSRDLDLNPETLLNPAPSYTTLLLEDIQNFHQKNTPSFSLPPCVTKACSILEAVADLNSTTSSNLSCAFSEDRKNPLTDQSNKNGYNFSSAANLVGKKISEAKDPFVESEVLGSDDLMEPSFHKYVTVRRGGTLGDGDMEEQESSGSNSVVGGGQHHWGFSSSSWEPNSADSTDRWTSRSNTREEDQSPLGFQRHALSESGHDVNDTRRGLSGKKREQDHQKGIGRGRIAKGLHTSPIVAAAAST